MQTDAVAQQLDRIADLHTAMAIAMFIVSVIGLGIAAGALRSVIRMRKAFDRSLLTLPAKTDPVVASITRVAENAREVSEIVRFRTRDVLDNLEEVSVRLKIGAESVEDRIKRFGLVMDVVQAEAEEILLDAASTARGVHTAAEVLRNKQSPVLPHADRDLDEDVFDE